MEGGQKSFGEEGVRFVGFRGRFVVIEASERYFEGKIGSPQFCVVTFVEKLQNSTTASEKWFFLIGFFRGWFCHHFYYV